MPARAIASATISFGLVSIPIKVYSSNVSGSGVHFNMLHEKCNSRLKQQYICPKDNEIVPRENMIKGYEYTKGRYVTFTDKEIKSFDEEATRSLDITEFVPIKEVDPIFFEKTYYIGPDGGGERAYNLLRAAMRETKRAAVAQYAVRGKQYVVLVRPYEEGLVMQQLRWHDEIRGFDEVPIGDSQVKAAELQLAVQLVEQIATEKFSPEKYDDEVRKRIEAAIDAKVKGEELTAAPAEVPKAQIIDIMEALKASLGEDAGEDGEAKPAKKTGSKRKTAKRAAQKVAKPKAKKKRAKG